MRTINKIIIHCSDSEWGNAVTIDQWHRARKFSLIGYHYIILNDSPTSDSKTYWTDGVVETGRSIERVGAHCKGENEDSIGICLIGREHFSTKQWASLDRLLEILKVEYNLNDNDIYGHNDFDNKKTCPNFNVKDWLINS